MTATEAVAKFKDGSLTVEEYARSLLERIAARDAAVKAWAHLDPDLVIDQARKLDQVEPENRGPLHGVAIAVKDVIYTKGGLSREDSHHKHRDASDLEQTCLRNSTRLYMRATLLGWMRHPL